MAWGIDSDSSQPAKVAIIGGGLVGLEGMLALDAIDYPKADVHLFSPKARFVPKPPAVSSGFGRGDLFNFDLPKLTATAGATFHNLSVSEVITQDRVTRLPDDTA